MGDFDLTPPALPGEKPIVKKEGFFKKLFVKNEPTPPRPNAAPLAVSSDAPTPNLDEIKRKLGIDSEPDILPVAPSPNIEEKELPRTPTAVPVGTKVDIDDWTQDEAASELMQTSTPAEDAAINPWDKVITMDETPPPQVKHTEEEGMQQHEQPVPVTAVVPMGKPEHHALIEQHLADLDRQHEKIEQKLQQISQEAPQLPDWSLQNKEITPDQYFFLRNGQPIRSIAELGDALEFIDDITFEHHVNEYRNDFANWIRDVIGDKELAARLQATDNRAAMLRELLNVKEHAVKAVVKEHRELQKTITKRKEAVATLLEAEKQIAALQHRVEEKSKELTGERKRSAKLVKEKLDKEVERRLSAERDALLKARSELTKAKQEYQSKTKGIDARERSLDEREKRVMLDETQARKDIEMVSRMKQEIEPMLRDAAKVKAELEAAHKSEQSTKKMLAELKSVEDAITRKEDALRAREKKTADDLTRIMVEKEALGKQKQDLDKRESLARKLETDAHAMMADAKSRRDTALTTERSSRERINADMKRLTAIKAQIDKELSKITDQKQKITRAVGLRRQYEEALGSTKRSIVKEREQMETEAYASYMKEKTDTTAAGQRQEPTNEDVLKAKHTQVYAKVEACRQALETKDLETAKRLYGELRDDYTKISLGATEKEALYNDIRELYDDIHLMLLAK